jgi:hypothetical protein
MGTATISKEQTLRLIPSNRYHPHPLLLPHGDAAPDREAGISDDRDRDGDTAAVALCGRWAALYQIR